jgi:hypothetical protein
MSRDAIAVLMAEGNKTVYKLIVMCFQVDANIVLTADTMNLRGTQLFHIFLSYCEGFFPKFRACIMSRDQDMIDWINKQCPEWTAVKNRLP